MNTFPFEVGKGREVRYHRQLRFDQRMPQRLHYMIFSFLPTV